MKNVVIISITIDNKGINTSPNERAVLSQSHLADIPHETLNN